MRNFRIVLAALMVLLAVSLGWAGGSQEKAAAPTAPAASTPQAGQTAAVPQDAELRVGVANFEPELDPAGVTSNAATQILNSIHETLIYRNPYGPPLKYEPGLATSWQWVSDTAMEFKLRPNVKFHDGSVVTAGDVAYSLNRIFKIEEPDFKTAQGRFFDNFVSVDVVDAQTVRVNFKRKDPLAEMMLSAEQASVVPEAYVKKVGYAQSQVAPIGAGPYRVAKFVPDKELIVERFDGYWGAKAPLKRIHFFFIPEVSSRITALANGEVDFITSVPPDQEGMLKGKPNVKLLPVVWPMFHVYVLNMNYGPTANPKIRQAMILSIDRDALNKALWAGKGKVPKSHTYEEYGDLYLKELELIKYDPQKAKQLVKESGYDGTPIELTFLASYYTYGNLAAQAIAEMWQGVGLKVNLRALETFNSKDYPTTMIRPWSNPVYYPDPMGAIDPHWSPAGWPARNKMFDTSSVEPEWGTLYQTMRFSTDPVERREAYKKMMVIAETKLFGWILLYQPAESFAMRSDIRWEIPTMQRPYYLAFRAGQISFSK